jgi:glyceraldehyde-3-phosphate dehydrogenase/erythrose-4-phosphate dehydrogenase
MTYRIAINGAGRIGRLTIRALLARQHPDIQIVAINDLTATDMIAHLLVHDSVHGRFNGTVEVTGDDLIVNGHQIVCLKEPDPAKLPWSHLSLDLVLECGPLYLGS